LQAVVKYDRGPANVELREVPEPAPSAGQVKVAVKMAGICGSDLHIYHDDIQITIVPPVVMGHEFSGEIVEVGAGVTGFQVGDRVTCETTAVSCGHCPHCRSGRYNMCTTRRVVGYAFDGCFAPFCLAYERQLHHLPANVDEVAGALTEPLACCVHAVLDLTQIVAGDVVAITGPGPIGLLTLQLAKAAGACVVVCGTARDGERLKLARRLGADATLDLSVDDLHAWLRPRTEGQGADVFLECSGAPAAVRLGLVATRRRGQYTQIGLMPAPFEVDFSLIAYRELRVAGALGQSWPSWTRSLDLMSRGSVDPRCLVSHTLPLSEWREAFRLVEEQRGLKVMLQPGG
jgi:L-iditol 2-dehydrogenase